MRRLMTTALPLPAATPALESSSELDLRALQQMIGALEEECLRVDEAAEVADTLTELGVAADSGTLGDAGCRVLAVATESLLASVGYSEPLFVALEDGSLVEHQAPTEHQASSSTSAAPAATAVDSRHIGQKIVDKAKEIWRAIISALKRIRVWFNDIVRKLLDSTPWIQRQIDGLEKEVVELQSQGVKTDMTTFEAVGSYNLQRSLAGYKEFPQNIVKMADYTVAQVQTQLKRLSHETIYNGSFVKQITDNLDSISYDPAAEAQMSNLTRNLIFVGGKEIPKTGRHMCSEDMLGDRIVGQVLGPRSKGAEALYWYAYTPALTHEERKNEGKWTASMKAPLPVQRLLDCKELLRAAKELCKAVLDFRQIQAKLEHMAGELETMAEQQIKRLETSGVEAWKDEPESKGRQRFMSQAGRIFASEPANMVLYAQRSARALAEYVQMHVKLYKASVVKA